ncbi:MAG TPA: beta-ketoacyl synthase N-terminal-like domain-containing protein, partial [Ktedonobacteraceae bacterium]|nr:beta-ketoacyl synthase N-terminal-like domain-containing protein [Ktedonobacteraceae bacterium]
DNALGKLGRTIADYAMNAQEGLEVLVRVLANRSITRALISTGDLQARIQQWVRLETLAPLPEESRSSMRHKVGGTYVEGASTSTLADSEIERIVTHIWKQALGVEQVSLYDNFFDLGGNSLIGLQVLNQLKKALHVQLPAVALFDAPTISSLVRLLRPKLSTVEEASPLQQDFLEQRRRQARVGSGQQAIAVVSMAGRFPGAGNIEQFWENLREGVESISFFTPEELREAGVPAEVLADPNYVRARPILQEVEQFDAGFFGYSPREAELMDPQHRLFLESSWEVLERGGYDPQSYEGLIGVFGGANISTYLLGMAAHSDVLESVDDYSLVISNDKDSLATGVSYKLNLRGPSIAVQTFCSTSLVAVHLACQSLRAGECDLALAGGVSVRVPMVEGHLYQQGGMESPDGHVRTFDAQARGSMFGDGVGVVLLKRLEEALADGDQIEAVIRGSALNNDGSVKVSYTAPSVAGQAEVVQAALEQAGVEAESISYVEAHGTATELGDPIEVAALTRAYRRQTQQVGYCAIGSVKTNVGHLDRAAGVSGLIKTVLSLKHEQIPPSLHYQQPNPQIDFASSPFYVNARLSEWKRGERVRRAGINSLGMGGTNVHVVVEEAPAREGSGESREWKVVVVSGRTPRAVEEASRRLGEYLRGAQAQDLADVAYTLQVGRRRFEHRRALLCRNSGEAIRLLGQMNENPAGGDLHRVEHRTDRPVAFLFPGVGEQYPGMARELYEKEAVFRETVDDCCDFLLKRAGLDLRDLIFSEKAPAKPGQASTQGMDLRALLGRNGTHNQRNTVVAEKEEVKSAEIAARLKQTEIAQPLVFVVEYALAQLLFSWGIRPSAMLGYSLGEYVAACLCGGLSLEDALTRVAGRARLIAQMPAGAMLAVAL